jgi:MoaA/NifB/PqqE/SkfB family radical SAM enzyme
MQCRICNGDWSHLIGREIQQSGSDILKNFYKVPAKNNQDSLKEMSDQSVQEIIELAKQAKYVYLTGGEPTIHKQAIHLIDTLVETGCAKDQILQISTNVSAINPGLLEKFSAFRRVTLTMSIDATGPVANYQRYGSDWNIIEKNVRSLCDLKNSVNTVDLHINMSISACSILDIDTTIKWYLDLWDYCKLGLVISVVHYPFHAIMLRGKCRQLATEKVHRAIELFEEKIKLYPELVRAMSESGNNLDQLKKLYSTLLEPELSDKKSIDAYRTNFYLPMLELDRIRGQSFEQLFGLSLDAPDNYDIKEQV